MRFLLLFALIVSGFTSAQSSDSKKFLKDSLVIIAKKPEKGFNNDYILFIPKGTPTDKMLYLLVEPNNTGKLSDSMQVHKKHAIDLASVSSVGNNVATEIKIPLLVPIFPRPATDSLIYTHALDRDVIVETRPEMRRLDLQLVNMIDDARKVLATVNITVADKIFMNGFSASGTFTNRFSFIHPEKIKALAIGGFNGKLMIPQTKLNGIKLNYPIGIADFKKIFNKKFDLRSFRSIAQMIYMGKLDENDAVKFDDAYSSEEKKIINENLGENVQSRYLKCQQLYRKNGVDAIFKTYDKVGHWTNSEVNLAVIRFFLSQMDHTAR